ncbi:unnamed protein product [Oikopleura dioica]|uniref:Uncharacterized protein n=1 Tax=Oikopleura dioica TaxID=34765 RepID=E4YA69_OIKDI|nr:unnamed protein product [Oikopleura dioica]
MLSDGEWAWELYPHEDNLWQLIFHGNPLDHLPDPRTKDKTGDPAAPVLLTQDEPDFVNPDVLTSNVHKSSTRIQFDTRLKQLIFGTTVHRVPSADNLFFEDETGLDDEDICFRTHTYDEKLDGAVYVPTRKEHAIHFAKLTPSQYKVFYTEADKNANNSNWIRVGITFHDYYLAKNRMDGGDLTFFDSQGLEYQLELRVKENLMGLPEERWSPDEVMRARHVVFSLTRCCQFDSPYFRSDLFRRRPGNVDDYKTIGFDAIEGIRTIKDTKGKERQEIVAQVLQRVSIFKNLCPLAADRANLRRILGKDDSLLSTHSLLNPVDASYSLTSILQLPRFERNLYIVDNFHQGSSIGSVTFSVPEKLVEHPDTQIPVSSSTLASTTEPQLRDQQADLNAKAQRAYNASQAPALTYQSITNRFPVLVEQPSDIPTTDSDSTELLSDSISTGTEPAIMEDLIDRSVSSGTEPAIMEDLPCKTSNPSITESVLTATSSSPQLGLNLAKFGTWCRLLASRMSGSNPLLPASVVKTALSEQQNSEFVHTCAPDPRSHLPSSSLRSANETDSLFNSELSLSADDSLTEFIQVHGQTSSTDHPSHTSLSPKSSNTSCITEIITDDSFFTRETVSSLDPIILHQDESHEVISHFEPACPHEEQQKAEDVVSDSPPIPDTEVSAPVEQLRLPGPPPSLADDLDAEHDPLNEESFNLVTPRQVSLHTAQTHSEHLADLAWMFFSRILNRGTRRELHILAHQQPSPFYKHARCLDGLSPTQVRRIIGPFSPEEITAFQRRFFPTRADRERLDARTRLANLVIPDTSQDFHPLIDPSPAMVYTWLQIEEDLSSHTPFGYYATDAPELVNPESGLPSSAPKLPFYDNVTGQFITAPGDVRSYHRSLIPQSTSKTQDFTEALSITPEFSQYLENLIDSKHPETDNPNSTPDDIFTSLQPSDNLPVLDWLIRNFRAAVAADVNDEDTASILSEFVTLNAEPTEVVVEDVSVPPVTQSIESTEAKTIPLPDYLTPAQVKDYRRELQSLPASKTTVRGFLFSFCLPPTTVPVLMLYHRLTLATSEPSHKPVFGRTQLVHPVLPQILAERFTFTLEAFQLFFDRETAAFVAANPTALGNSSLTLPSQIFRLHDRLRQNADTRTYYFPKGTVLKLLAFYLYPRSVSLGYQLLLRSASLQPDSSTDPYTTECPVTLKPLRGFIDKTAYISSNVKQYDFAKRDRRFAMDPKLRTEVFRPQSFLTKIRFLEPTFFNSLSNRQWLIILNDLDTHSWNHISALSVLFGRMEILTKSLTYAPMDAVPGKVGVPHFLASRPGLPGAYFLTIAAGSLRTDLPRSSMPTVSPRWSLRITARFITSLFCGLVRRVPLHEARRRGITSANYDRIMTERNDHARYYHTVTRPDGVAYRRRRLDVHAPSLTGSFRPIYEVKPDGSRGSLRFYEEIIWPGASFSHRIINTGEPNLVTTQTGSKIQARYGGPRVILARTSYIEEEFLEAFNAIPYFYLTQWSHIYERARTKYSTDRSLQREASLTDVVFQKDTIPPLWAVNLHKGRCYYGSNFYLDLENLLISIERGLDLYPNYHVPEADSDFLEHLHPYQLPHLIPGTECLQRVNRAGSVVYASEEKADLSTMSDVIPLQQGLSVPPCAADHSQFVAHLTTNHRSHQSNIGRSKLYSTLEFKDSDVYY